MIAMTNYLHKCLWNTTCRIRGLKYSLINVYKVRLSIHTQRKVLWSPRLLLLFLVSAVLDRKGFFSSSMFSLSLFITINRLHWLSTYTSNYIQHDRKKGFPITKMFSLSRSYRIKKNKNPTFDSVLTHTTTTFNFSFRFTIFYWSAKHLSIQTNNPYFCYCLNICRHH
jgi:hypothetical protein